MAAAPELPRASTLEELLDLEELDRDLYRAHNPRRSFTAPSLRRAGRGAGPARRGDDRSRGPVPPFAPRLLPPSRRGRLPHDHAGDVATVTAVRSRPGTSSRSSAGRRSSPRRRRSTSTRRAETSRAYPSPPTSRLPRTSPRKALGNEHVLFELRPVYGPPPPGPDDWHGARRIWGRTREPLPDRRVLHACGIVYLSDISTGFAELDVEGLPRGGTSLDHTVYFHRPARADDWLLMELEPVSAAGARGRVPRQHPRPHRSARGDARAGEPDASSSA